MTQKRYTPVLTIAGSDPSGGAGIQADLKTITSTGCYGMSAITAITVQNTRGVISSTPLDPALVADQLKAIFDDITPAAIKIGMVATAPIAAVIADTLKKYAQDIPTVLDPVMVSTSGHRLMDTDAETIMLDRLIPAATIITPNYRELQVLTSALSDDTPVEKRIDYIAAHGANAILITGGDSIDESYSTDLLRLPDSDKTIPLKADRIRTANTHGTGCTLSSAIASFIALGFPLIDAVKAAKSYITRALIAGADVKLGHGHGPVNHTFGPRRTRFKSWR